MAIFSARKHLNGPTPKTWRQALLVLGLGVALSGTQLLAAGTPVRRVITPASNPARQTLLSSQSARAWNNHYARVSGRNSAAAQRRAKISNRKAKAQQRRKARAAKR